MVFKWLASLLFVASFAAFSIIVSFRARIGVSVDCEESATTGQVAHEITRIHPLSRDEEGELAKLMVKGFRQCPPQAGCWKVLHEGGQNLWPFRCQKCFSHLEAASEVERRPGKL